MSAPARETLPPPNPHPVTLIRTAVVWCRAAGIPVRLTRDWGIHCVSQHAARRWERDPRAGGVSPLGAAVLNCQPEATELRDAAADCLFVPERYIRALEAGLNHEDFDPGWADALDHRLMVAGYEAGIRFRDEFVRARGVVLS